jgi:uncharacterized membrane protein YkvA (DUF1232 family)
VQLLIGFGSAIAAVWLLMLVAVIRAKQRGESIKELGRLIPDLARLLTRLARDRTIPVRVRARILVAIASNVQPINLIPDFIPVIGLLDDLVVTVWAIRSTVRRAGKDALTRHWPGTPEGLAKLSRVARLDQAGVSIVESSFVDESDEAAGADQGDDR